MIFFEVPTAAALAEAEENKGKLIRKPNRFYVHSHTTHESLGTTAKPVKQFPVIHIQAGKSVLVTLEAPVRNSNLGGVCLNMSVKVNGQTWYNLGNSGYTCGKTSNGVKTIETIRETKVLDFVTGLGLDPLADYNLQFYITGRSYSGGSYVNQYCAVNFTGAGGQGGSVKAWRDQSYLSLTVQEMD